VDKLESKLGFRRIRPGDEVIVPALTWSTTVWPILQAGGIPVFVDSDPETLQVPMEQIELAWSHKTAGVAAVHLLGNAIAAHELKSLCTKRGVALVEDTCESLGTRTQNQMAGTIGNIGTYSFFFSHHMTTIEGGMIVSPHPEMAELFRCLRAHGWTRHLKQKAQIESMRPDLDPRFLFVNMGFNVRPTEINAAFGLHQLKKLDGFNRRRVEIAQRWLEAFAPFIHSNDLHPMIPTPGTECTWFGFPCTLKDQKTRNSFRDYLESSGIETRPIVCGNLARQPAFEHFPHRIAGTLKGADAVMDRGIYWGSHPLMTDAEIEYVIQTVRAFFEKESNRL
jgi:CDP-6-deoxy-D-xylo-4-hexulose-3-dehydrase